MVIGNCLLSPTSENPLGFLAWYLLGRLSVNQILIAGTVDSHRKKEFYNLLNAE